MKILDQGARKNLVIWYVDVKLQDRYVIYMIRTFCVWQKKGRVEIGRLVLFTYQGDVTRKNNKNRKSILILQCDIDMVWKQKQTCLHSQKIRPCPFMLWSTEMAAKQKRIALMGFRSVGWFLYHITFLFVESQKMYICNGAQIFW